MGQGRAQEKKVTHAENLCTHGGQDFTDGKVV